MFSLGAVGLAAFVLCLVTTPLIRNIFSRAKLLDHPDEKRKLHRQAMPRVGGIAIMLSFLAALAIAPIVYGHRVLFAGNSGGLLVFLLPATALIFVTGLIDDLVTLKPWQKLLGQVLAASLALSLGARIALPHGPLWLASCLSILWLLVCTNAFNLIDGVDGLAAGVALFASAATMTAASLGANPALALVAAALAGCLLGFLRYNFHPATIFLGDCGSLTIGFMLGCFAIDWSRSRPTTSGMAAPLIMLALPLLDVVLALGRRFLRDEPLFQGDRHHIHHKVLARALSTRRAVLILYAVSALTAMLSLVVSYGRPRSIVLVLVLFSVLAFAGIANLRYVEFSAARRSVCRGFMLRLIKHEIYLDELAIALARAKTIDAVWDIACIACEDLQVSTLTMNLCDRSFHIAIKIADDTLPWNITVPLGQQGELSITRSTAEGPTAPLVAVLERFQLSIGRMNFANEALRAEESLFSYQGAA